MERDELLKPTLAGREQPTPYTPWRLSSQVYVGFFGGALALGAIAFLNAAMLGMSYRARAAIVAIALAAEAALVGWVALSGTEEIRISSSAAGLLAFGGAYLIQRSPDRVYHWHADDEAEEAYQSLWTHGLVAVIAARIFEAILLKALDE